MKILTGMQCRDLERYYGLVKEIAMFERERVEKDIKNVYKYKELYRLFYKLQEQLRREELIWNVNNVVRKLNGVY